MQEDRPSRLKRREARRGQRSNGREVTRDANRPIVPPTTSSLSPTQPTNQHIKFRGYPLQASLAVVGGRAAGALSRRLHLGGGTSIAGLVAQRLYPDIIGHLSTQLEHGSILVTGTNGKTTTSGFIAAILSDAGLRVWRNREGSNLMRGIAGALVIRTQPNGRLRRAGKAISIFEVDEAAMPSAAATIPTRVAVFTNLFRDQLDRYGEVDSVAARWTEAINALSGDTVLVLNADDPTTANLGETFTGQALYFGIDDAMLDLMSTQAADQHQVLDTRTCPYCGGTYTYTLRFYSHIGHYTCANCGRGRPQPDVRAVKVEAESFDRLRVQIETPTQQGSIVIPLPGLYNIYNALAAIATAEALHIAWGPIVSGIEQFKPAFGRGERVQVEGRTIRLLLAKNPTGFNEVLRALFSDETRRHVLFVLNDNIADGRDISWIWDVDFERTRGRMALLTVTGTRALDLALRLKYAHIAPDEMIIVPPAPLKAARRDSGIQEGSRRGQRQAQRGATAPQKQDAGLASIQVESSGDEKEAVERLYGYGIAKALDTAIQHTPEGETLFVVPTYTGLLEVHRELERRGLTPHYWEEKGP